jgi:hypothetical protein
MAPVYGNSLSLIPTDLASNAFLCFFAWRLSVIELLPPPAIEKIALHMVHFITIVSPKLTTCINGNSIFNESLKLHFHFFENMLYHRGDHTLLVFDTTAALNHTYP